MLCYQVIQPLFILKFVNIFRLNIFLFSIKLKKKKSLKHLEGLNFIFKIIKFLIEFLK